MILPAELLTVRFPIEDMYHGARIAPKGFTHVHRRFSPTRGTGQRIRVQCRGCPKASHTTPWHSGTCDGQASRSQFATDSRESLRRHLLILTARNRLLNLTHGRAGNVRVIDELPDDLHPPLLSETEVRFSAVPDPTREHLIEFVYLRNDLDTGLDEPVTRRPHGGVVGQDARAGAALRSAEPASGRGGRSVLVPDDERA
jgi:hypothetical protein